MGFRDEAANAAISKCMAAPNGRDLAGVPSSLKPVSKIRDLRHPKPVRPFFSKSTLHSCVLLPAWIDVWAEHRADRQVLAMAIMRGRK
jgi:hypothetical protein